MFQITRYKLQNEKDGFLFIVRPVSTNRYTSSFEQDTLCLTPSNLLFAYRVFVFIYSAFDLQFVILHKGLVPPSTFGEGVIMCFPGKTLYCLVSCLRHASYDYTRSFGSSRWRRRLRDELKQPLRSRLAYTSRLAPRAFFKKRF